MLFFDALSECCSVLLNIGVPDRARCSFDMSKPPTDVRKFIEEIFEKCITGFNLKNE